MSRLLAALSVAILAAAPFASTPARAVGQNMDKCVFFSWAHTSEAPSVFQYRLTNYCKRRVYVQVCVAETTVCRGHYLNRIPRQVERRLQEPTKRGDRMVYRAVAN